MPYIICYDHLFDDLFQCEVSGNVAAEARQRGSFDVYDEPAPNIPIRLRYRSVNHPGWADDDISTGQK